MLQRQRVAAALHHAEPLLQAVERHAAAHGRPPASLAELVPAPSPAMLSTGLMGEPQYAYRIMEHDTSAWALTLREPSLLAGTALYEYRSNGRYDEMLPCRTAGARTWGYCYD